MDTKKRVLVYTAYQQITECMKETDWRETEINQFQKNLMDILQNIYPEVYLSNDIFDCAS